MKVRIVTALACLPLMVSSADEIIDCNNALTTIEMNQCASVELELVQIELNNYFTASLTHHAQDVELVESINIAQKNWQIYMSSHCDSVYTQWRDGTIRGLMTISCKTNLTKQRTLEIWTNFLTYIDSTPPVLPKPSK